jgi:predicted phosphodiesterase
MSRGKFLVFKVKLLGLLFVVFASLAVDGQRTPTVSQFAKNAVTEAERIVSLPNAEGSIKFAAVGDTGRGTRVQYELGAMMAAYQEKFQYDTIILTGDNMYYDQKPEDYVKKFELPYKALIDRDVKFYASLGNHDEPNQRNYKLFNMDGKEYYKLVKGDASFYALNTVQLDKKQIDWFISELEKDTSNWKIAFFHHPPYSSAGRHGSDEKIREALHPLFIKYGVDVVFTGHDHTYERIKPMDGIQYFVTGAGGEVRKNDLKDRSTITAAGFDTDLSFMIVEIVGDEMHFQSISRTGATVDKGVVPNRVGESEPKAVPAESAAESGASASKISLCEEVFATAAAAGRIATQP